MTSRSPPPTSQPPGPDALRSSAVASRSGGSCVVLSGDEVAERLRRGQAVLLDLRHRLGDTTGST